MPCLTFHGMVIVGVLHRTLALGKHPAPARLDALVRSAIGQVVAMPAVVVQGRYSRRFIR